MHNIPSFPRFRKFTQEDRTWYNDYYGHFEPYADFSFGNLIMWLDQYDDLAVSKLNNNIVLSCTNLFMNNKTMVTFLGKEKVEDTLHQIFSYLRMQGTTVEVLGLPESIIKPFLENPSFQFINDRDNDEYIMDTHALVCLNSKHHRRKVQSFLRDFGEDIQIDDINLSHKEDVNLLMQSVKDWPHAFSTNTTAQQEGQVFQRVLKFGGALGYRCLGVFIGKALAAFAIYQPIPQPQFVIVNHMKADYKFKNVFMFMTHSLANCLHQQNIKFMNYEQDLGLPGLRDYKEHLHPAYFLKKFTVRPV